jgi:hypothetical protein
MTRIVIFDLHHSNSRELESSESFLYDLTEIDSMSVHGGEGYNFNEFLNLGVKVLEYALVGFAIYSIVSLVQSFLLLNNAELAPIPLLLPYNLRFYLNNNTLPISVC